MNVPYGWPIAERPQPRASDLSRPCVCGSMIVVCSLEEADVLLGVQAHQRTMQHLAWRRHAFEGDEWPTSVLTEEPADDHEIHLTIRQVTRNGRRALMVELT